MPAPDIFLLPSPSRQDGYHVMLDHRQLKSPARRPLVLPSRALALAIAAEWEQQARVSRARQARLGVALL